MLLSQLLGFYNFSLTYCFKNFFFVVIVILVLFSNSEDTNKKSKNEKQEEKPKETVVEEPVDPAQHEKEQVVCLFIVSSLLQFCFQKKLCSHRETQTTINRQVKHLKQEKRCS